MNVEVSTRSHGTANRVVPLITRMLTASLLVAVVGSLGNWFYEHFFAPELSALGNPFARALFVIAVSFPVTLAGLILLGLPISYVLTRFGAGNVVTYVAAGAVAGSAWGVFLLNPTSYGVGVSTAYGSLCALFWWWLRPRP